ncbi:MAG: cytochrome c, partial [Gammaproteobacteria bacterium]|nr:cytochrome c [Gammaproteobacteria bacterium]
MGKFNFVISLLLVCASTSPLFAQTNIWDGVYSEEQASRGQLAYRANCESCHGSNLGGNSNTPSLLGMSFMFIWEGRSLAELYTKMRENMPS